MLSTGVTILPREYRDLMKKRCNVTFGRRALPTRLAATVAVALSSRSRWESRDVEGEGRIRRRRDVRLRLLEQCRTGIHRLERDDADLHDRRVGRPRPPPRHRARDGAGRRVRRTRPLSAAQRGQVPAPPRRPDRRRQRDPGKERRPGEGAAHPPEPRRPADPDGPARRAASDLRRDALSKRLPGRRGEEQRPGRRNAGRAGLARRGRGPVPPATRSSRSTAGRSPGRARSSARSRPATPATRCGSRSPAAPAACA